MPGKILIALLTAAVSIAAAGASRIRLVYGKGWNAASEEVKKAMESAAFKTACKGKFTTEFVDWAEGAGNVEGNLGSLKIPCIFVLDEKGRCFFVFENVPSNYPMDRMVKFINRIDAQRRAAESAGLDTPDKCGKFLEMMEKFVGGPKRIISPGFYSDVFDKLVQLDPGDKEGWQRHFQMGDGIDLVIKANEYRADKDMAGGEKFINAELAKPRKHLTKEQQQGLLMAKFALYRETPAKNEEMIKLLETVAKYDETTFWGTCALGWLNWRGKAPISTYWGWHKGDFSGTFTKEIKYGVSYSFDKAGEYDISFEPTEGSVNISQVALYCGEEEVAALKSKPFKFKLAREYAGKIDRMVVKGSTASDSAGNIVIRRQILRPRKKAQ